MAPKNSDDMADDMGWEDATRVVVKRWVALRKQIKDRMFVGECGKDVNGE